MAAGLAQEIQQFPADKVEQTDLEHELPKHSGTAKEVFNAELYAAVRETKLRPWGKESLHLYVSIFCALLCVVANGYDSSLMTALIAMAPFQKTFHTTATGPTISLTFSIYTVGNIISCPIAAVVSDRGGRRRCMFVGAIIILIGMALTASASSVAQLTIGRLVLGSGVGFANVAAAAYSMEISPPHWRGRANGLYNCGWFLGSIPAAAITFGTNYIQSNMSWRLPLIFQAVPAGLVSILVWFIPESPRFYMANGRDEEALAFLVRYHGDNDPQSRLVALELQEMKDCIARDASDKRWWDYRPLFSTRAARWRSLQMIMMSVFGQFSGNGLGYFNTVIYQNLGVTSTVKQLGYNLASAVTGAFTGVLWSSTMNDKVSRRMILIWGTLGCSLMLAINAGLSALLNKQISEGNVAHSTASGALAAYFLFGNIYSITYSPLQAVVPVEALETTTRAKGLALSNIITGSVGFINQYAGPIALQNMTYKYVYVFVAWDAFESILWYLFCVESQGRTLEELAWIYDQPHPVTASKRLDRVIISTAGEVVGVEEE